MSLGLNVIVFDRMSFWSSAWRIVYNVFALGAVGDLEALNCQYALTLNRSTNFQFCSSPPIAPNACYRAFFFSRCPYVPSYAVKYSAIVSHFVTVNSCYLLSAKKLFKLSNRNFIFFNAKSWNDYGVLHL